MSHLIDFVVSDLFDARQAAGPRDTSGRAALSCTNLRPAMLGPQQCNLDPAAFAQDRAS